MHEAVKFLERFHVVGSEGGVHPHVFQGGGEG